MNKGDLINLVKKLSVLENIGVLMITLPLAITLPIGMYILDNKGLSMNNMIFIFSVFSILLVFSRNYENEKAQRTCFIFILLNIAIFLFYIFCNKEVMMVNKLASDKIKYFIMILDGFIIWSLCYFLYRYSTMPYIHQRRKYSEYSEIIYMIYNKSLNYTLNDSEKLKIKKFCEEEISKLSTIRLKIYKYIFKKKYLRITNRIKMYNEIKDKLVITFNI